MIPAAHQPQFLPWIGYFHKMANCDIFVYVDDVQYKKGEFQNRNKIRVAEGWIWLTVPVITKGKLDQKIKDVEINPNHEWKIKHLKSIEYAYKSAKYYKDYIGDVSSFYNTSWEKLNLASMHLINLFRNKLNINNQTHFSSEFNITTTRSQRLVDLCKTTGADTYLSGQGAKEYLDESLFSKNKIKVIYQAFKHPVYSQVYQPFEPYMSVLDLLLNCGPESREILNVAD